MIGIMNLMSGHGFNGMLYISCDGFHEFYTYFKMVNIIYVLFFERDIIYVTASKKNHL